MLEKHPRPDCVPLPGRSVILCSRVALSALALCASLISTSPASAQLRRPSSQDRPASSAYRLTPVQFWAAGRVIPLRSSAIFTGRDTYVPLAALPAIGARGSLSRGGATVTLRSGRADVLPVTAHNGIEMISLADLAIFANASVIKPSSYPAPGLRPNTTYFLAHLTDVRVQGSSLKITTSFPVPFEAKPLDGTTARGYVDCIGAAVGRTVSSPGIPAGERRVDRIRIAQFTPDITRVALDMAPGVTLQRLSTEGRVTPTFAAAFRATRYSGSGDGPIAGNNGGGYRPQNHGRPTPSTNGGQSNAPGEWNGDVPPTEQPQSPDRPAGGISTRTAEIRSISYEPQNNQNIQIFIETSRKVRAYVRYSATSRQVIVDIPNSRLNLDDPRQKDQDIQHPLVDGLTATTVSSSSRVPPLTKIIIDAPKIVSTAVELGANQVVIELTIPRTTRNNTIKPVDGKRSLVVVDAGHGGIMTGAKARVRNRNVYEKDITLAIASRLRSALEARGNRVVMTRRGDVNVPLEDRPRLANELGASIFISLHNDSWGKANAITGTTTYYHGNSRESRKLARCVEKQLALVSGMRDRGAVSDTNMYPIGFCVLRDTTMPAVLCELGYLNNSKDRSKLMNPAYQQRVAEAVCNGIRNYVSGEQNTARRHAKRQAPAA